MSFQQYEGVSKKIEELLDQKFEGELKRTKDAFRWRLVKSEYQQIMLLKAFLEQTGDVPLGLALQENTSILMEHLERKAHEGVIRLNH